MAMTVILLHPDSPLAPEGRALADGDRVRIAWIDGSERAPFLDVAAGEHVLLGTSVPPFFLKPLLLACERGEGGGVGLVVDGPFPAVGRIGLRWRPWLRAVAMLDGHPASLPPLLPAPLRRFASLRALVDSRLVPPLTFTELPCAFPPRIQIQTTTRCRAGCPYCPRPRQDVPDRWMEPALFEQLVAQCADGRPDWVELYLHGEPQQDPRLEQRAARLRAACPEAQLSVVTHEVMVAPRRAAALAAAGLDVMFVSVNVLEPPEPGELRRRLGRVAEAADGVRGEGGELVVVTLTDFLPPGTRSRFHRICRELALPLERFRSTSRSGDVDVSPWRRTAVRRTATDCNRPFTTAHVRYDGTVITCCEDWRYRRVLGRVGRSTLADIWTGHSYRTLRREVLSRDYAPPCDRCDLAVPDARQG
jgi:MoaA/NifB/PqqE/SkfB family radical SAM enzyme